MFHALQSKVVSSGSLGRYHTSPDEHNLSVLSSARSEMLHSTKPEAKCDQYTTGEADPRHPTLIRSWVIPRHFSTADVI